MSKVNDLVSEIIVGRKDAIKRISENTAKKQIIEIYAHDILKAFKISNEQELSNILLWQIKLCCIKFDYISVMISFERGNTATFYNATYLRPEQCKELLLGENKRLKEYIENLKIPSKAFDELYEYFKEEFSQQLKITKIGVELIIELKD